MERDSKGRFVKKAQTGTTLDEPRLSMPSLSMSNTQLAGGFNTSTLGILPFKKKIKYTRDAKGNLIDEFGNPINMINWSNFNDNYELDLSLPVTNTVKSEKSNGFNFDNLPDISNTSIKPINKTKLADYLDYAKGLIGIGVNNKIAERAIDAEKPFLQTISEGHRSIYGDYRAKTQGEQAAAQLRQAAANPLTSDGALQSQMQLEAQIKGQDYINQGLAQDDAVIKQTREIALQQNDVNREQRDAIANANRQAILMSEKNKSNILNMRDSANFSQIINPLISAKEQRLRNEGMKQEYYQDYYDDALLTQNVWKSFNPGLTPTQITLRDAYLIGGQNALREAIGEDENKYKEFLSMKQAMDAEVIRRQAELRGAYVNPIIVQNDPYSYFINSQNLFPVSRKKGGTIYKARLTKRTKDNDRAAKSIESTKKIAAKFLEKAIDSLYTYKDVELIAKGKKRKYQAGGGLPFVGITPVFASSETGVPKETEDAKTKKSDDLTSKDILELLKDMDGLPSDMQLIVHELQNFELQDDMDPLGLTSSSSIASRYIGLINKIKVAKFNREEYNQAFNQLKGNGGLNELAVTSNGMLIGTNQEGNFEYFTPDEVLNGDTQGYQLLTNSNLLYLRANSTNAAFNHQLTTFAQNGIGMEVITKQINDIISGLGSSKDSEEGFLQMGTKGQVKQGLQFLQKAAQEVGDDTINQNMSVADYYQAGYLTEEQANQAQLAIEYIKKALPANAQSLLKVKGGSDQGAEAIIKSLVYSKTSTETQFKAAPKKMSGKGSGSSGSSDDVFNLTPVQMMQIGYTDHMPVTLQKGTKYAMQVNAQVLPITDINKTSLGITTLDKVAESTFSGALDMNNVTMGSQLIDPQALQNVQVDATNLYVMNLPIDKNSPDGTIKPDLAWMKKIEAIDQVIRDQNIKDINQINKLYTDAGLPVLMNEDGSLNIQDYCKFGVLNGHALNSAFKDIDLLDDTMLEIEDEDQINNVLSILNKGRSEKDRIDFDSESWIDSIFGTDHDSIFEGTIYIPVRTNAFTGMIGGGNYPDTEQAEYVEALIQQKARTRGYFDPGLLN